MNTDNLVASLVGSLAWPIAAVILGLIFRKQLQAVFGGLAERMKSLVSLKAPGTELSFGDTLVNTQDELHDLKQASQVDASADLESLTSDLEMPGHGPFPDFDWDGVFANVKKSPTVTVIDSWSYLELAVRDLARRMDIREATHNFITLIGAVLAEIEGTDATIFNLKEIDRTLTVIRNLYELRNRVVHGEKVTSLEASDYAVSARTTIEVLYGSYISRVKST